MGSVHKMNFVEMTMICNACDKDDSVECKDACKDGVCKVLKHAPDAQNDAIVEDQ